MHILLTRCLIECSSSEFQCMNCPVGQNTALEIHWTGWEKCHLTLTPLSLFLAFVRSISFFLSGKCYNTSAVKPRTCTRLKTQLFHACAFYSKRRKALLFVPPPAKCECFNCVWHRPLSHSPTLSACPLQSTVAVQTLLLSGVRRRGDLQRLGGTPGEALDQQAAHRWAKKKYTRVTSPKDNMWSPRWIKAIFISCNYSTLHQCFNIDLKWEMCFSARWKRKRLFWSS